MSRDASATAPGACLFVYGTLRRGRRNRYACLLARSSEFAGRARLPARLYRLKPYPGLILQAKPGEWVEGELFKLKDARRLFSVLDCYEGSEYRRVRTMAVTESRRRVRCWVYELRETAA